MKSEVNEILTHQVEAWKEEKEGRTGFKKEHRTAKGREWNRKRSDQDDTSK